ncbi:molybdenum cofactor guanylyltransferase [Marinomonas agarivorans]|nr:molybdenum cofactor guanylyltransferase [Marinomonas agarivorans]
MGALMRISFLGVVLAGGKASRMAGQPKGLMPFKGRPMCQYILIALKPVCNGIAINVNKSLSLYKEFSDLVFADEEQFANLGPLSGIYSALCFAEIHDFTHIIISPCDTPNIQQELFRQLRRKAETTTDTIFYAKSHLGLQPLHAVLPVVSSKKQLEIFLQTTQEKRVVDFYHACHGQVITWENEESFLNINRMSELDV